MAKKESRNLREQKTQKTKPESGKPTEIPVPKRGEFDLNMMKLAKRSVKKSA